jgi:RNA 3'-terminal phosphate cyclase
LGADALGTKGVPAEIIGTGAAKRLLSRIESGAGLDHHLADNLIPWMALTGGRLKPDRITDHILANIYVCEQFLETRFEVDSRQGLITCRQGR